MTTQKKQDPVLGTKSSKNSERAANNDEEPNKLVIDEDEQNTTPPPPSATGCGILGRYPVVSVLAFAVVGIGIGIGLSVWDPSGDATTKDAVIQWIGLIGDLFVRALQCVVLPLVFVNVVMSILDMMNVGKAGSIGWKTIGLYLVTTVMASILGIITTLLMMDLYSEGNFPDDSPPPLVTLGCTGETESFMGREPDGNVACLANSTADDENTQFVLYDLTGALLGRGGGGGGPRNDLSLSDTIYEGVFTKIVAKNIFVAFAEGNFAAVVFFAIVFGVALSRVVEKISARGRSGSGSFVVDFLKEVDATLLIMINWIIMITPFAVLSLIASAIGAQANLGQVFANVGYLVIATMLAMILQVLLVYIGLFWLITRSNPFTYLKHIVPAQTMAFACASSAATIPMTLKSVMATGRVPESIARFVVPLGATINMDGGAIYFPCACIWLAVLNGITPNVASFILLVIISTIGSAGTAPVPSASLVLIITAYNTVFGTTGTPEGFAYILAVDWFVDRLRTTVNVTGDAVVSGMVSHLCPLESIDDSFTNNEEASGENEDPSDAAQP